MKTWASHGNNYIQFSHFTRRGSTFFYSSSEIGLLTGLFMGLQLFHLWALYWNSPCWPPQKNQPYEGFKTNIIYREGKKSSAVPLLCISVKRLCKGTGNSPRKKLQWNEVIHFVCVSKEPKTASFACVGWCIFLKNSELTVIFFTWRPVHKPTRKNCVYKDFTEI